MNHCRVGVLLTTLLLAAAGADAASQKVFRCGPDGRTYSQTPCKDGYEVSADDKRSDEQRKVAEDNARREEKRVEKMTREREAREAAAAKQGFAVIANPAAARPAASAASAAAKKKRPTAQPSQP